MVRRNTPFAINEVDILTGKLFKKYCLTNRRNMEKQRHVGELIISVGHNVLNSSTETNNDSDEEEAQEACQCQAFPTCIAIYEWHKMSR